MDAVDEARRKQRGTKRVCKSCEKRFYDLGRDPTVCPECQSALPLAAFMPPPEVTRPAYPGARSRSAPPHKILPVADAIVASADDEPSVEETPPDAPAAEADSVLEFEDETDGDVTDLVAPDGDDTNPDE